MLKLRFQLFFWRSLGRMAIWLRDKGQRCFTWYEQHSPMKIVTDRKPAAMRCAYPPETCIYLRGSCSFLNFVNPRTDKARREGRLWP